MSTGNIAAPTGIGARPRRIMLQNPAPPVPNGDGSFTQVWADLEPFAVWASIEGPPNPQEEQAVGGTTTTTATHMVRLPYHRQVTERTRVLYDGRRFNVSAVANPDESNAESVLTCEELK
jgi:SPP1 family predicted phage head-tail adaptor